MNCKKVELPLKTEVTYWLKKNEIDPVNLVCRDEILMSNNIENFILVDHHVSPYHEKVIGVIDHRPFDESANLVDECNKNILEVGSCASLILEAIKKDNDKVPSEILKLLYGPIVLDTINFSKDADKVRPLDYEMAEFIERSLKIENIDETRRKIFDELVFARADISALDSLQLLSKDLKIISNSSSRCRVAIPGVQVFEYVKMPNAEESVNIFAEKENIDVVILMGMKPVGNTVERMLGVINIKNKNLYDAIVNLVNNMKNPELNLQKKTDINFMGGDFFYQGNVKASRKQILPIIKEILDLH